MVGDYSLVHLGFGVEALFDLLRATDNAGIVLTESFAMWPAAAVSGYYFSHPEARYWGSAASTRTRSRTTPAARV
jgi:hypothetical protein